MGSVLRFSTEPQLLVTISDVILGSPVLQKKNINYSFKYVTNMLKLIKILAIKVSFFSSGITVIL